MWLTTILMVLADEMPVDQNKNVNVDCVKEEADKTICKSCRTTLKDGNAELVVWIKKQDSGGPESP